MNKTTFELTGITCANCAQKIEDTIGKLKGVQNAKLIFATQKLDIVFDQDITLQTLESKVRKTVSEFEAGAEVLGKAGSSDAGISLKPAIRNQKLKKDMAALITGVLLFAAGLLTKENFSLSFILFLLAWLSAGGSVLYSAARNMTKGRIFDENLLMTIATIGAIATAQYPEAAAVMLFYKVGMLLEDMAVGGSRRSIAALMDLKPEYANLKTEAGIVKVAPDTVQIGDIIIVKPGERIPLDCCVIEGESFIDTSSLTGESLPVKASSGDQLLGGCINKTGLLVLQAVNSLEQSAITRILALVQDAASKKAPLESFISRFAAYYTPAVTGAAFLTAVLPPLLTGSMDFKTWLYRAMIFLVISCPCALVVSIPLTFFAGIGKASSQGILVKGGNYLEALNKVDTIVFDKTGTLTEGVFSVSEISPQGCSEAELLEYAAYAEANSLHPIAQSIVKEFGKPIDETAIESCEETAGKGVMAAIRGHLTVAGNLDYIKGFCMIPDTEHDTAGTLVYIAVDGEYKGLIKVSDALRKDAVKAVEGLRKNGVQRFVMLTGDSQKPAEAVGKALGLDEIHYGLLPDQKVKLFEQVKKTSKGNVLFVGDGINDAPVLAMADIGVSMGGLGSDAAIEASDIVLMTDEPSKLIEAVNTASNTRKIAMQNIIFALSVKVLILLLDIIGMATMWEAVFADVGVTLLAVLNTLRIGAKLKSSKLS
jgi:Cd2+/Zn2+-exporting ATPase